MFFLSNSSDDMHPGVDNKNFNQHIAKAYGPFYNRGGGGKNNPNRGATYILFYSITKKTTSK